MFIKNLRKTSHMSQAQLAETSELSLRTIQRVESGHRVGFASLRALAKTFNINVDLLEQELYSMDNIINEYKDFPLWLRLYIGSGWFSATRKEFQKIEIFFVIFSLFTASFWLSSFYFSYGPAPLPFIDVNIGDLIGFCSVISFLGAYNNSISIRLGDKYDIWSKLELTQPKLMFGIFKRRKSDT
jgi:transcriptional regulator with XRE-family HTH domain